VASIEPNWAALILFAAVWTVTCVALLTLIGMVPLRSRPNTTKGEVGAALVIANLALLALLSCGAILYAATMIRWSSAIIAGGLVVLFAPALFEVWPKDWRDSRAGLLLLIVVQAAALATLAEAIRGA
jgi:hypothetical protein